MQAIHAQRAKSGRLPPRAIHHHVVWRTNYIGAPERPATVVSQPDAFMVEMSPHGAIPPHFHRVDQFQVLMAGSGTLGRTAVPLIALHYVDHHTAYGPVQSGPLGLTLFTIRPETDPGGVYLHKPGYKDQLEPTPKRYLQAHSIALSTEPVLESRTEAVIENLVP